MSEHKIIDEEAGWAAITAVPTGGDTFARISLVAHDEYIELTSKPFTREEYLDVIVKLAKAGHATFKQRDIVFIQLLLNTLSQLGQ